MRRLAPVVLLLALAALLGWYVVYSRRVVEELQREAAREGELYARVWRALADTNEQASTTALLDLATHIREKGVPVVITDAEGNPTESANVRLDPPVDDARLRAYVRHLDTQNEPVVVPGVGTVHFGHTVLVEGLRIVPLVQVGLIVLLGFAALYAVRARGRAERERTWAGMAREAAHQLGTPLMSMSGWLELLGERREDPLVAGALDHMQDDLERLERVAHRFERIGNPPRVEPVDLGALVARVSDYFRARAPKLAKAVEVRCKVPSEPLMVQADPVLLEWALEAILKNALDALAGRGGRVLVTVVPLPEGGGRVRIRDDGPGIPRENRAAIFDAGFTTKSHGWGLGLSLARRIVEDNHHGRLALVPVDRGATFDIMLP